MKIRVAIAALLVASLFGFGFSRSVAADSPCPTIDPETDKEVHQCNANYVVDAQLPAGDFLKVDSVTSDNTLPLPHNSEFTRPIFTLFVTTSYVHMEVCITDGSSSGNVFFWSGSGPVYGDTAATGQWVALPTYHLPGWDCAGTIWPGTYTIN